MKNKSQILPIRLLKICRLIADSKIEKDNTPKINIYIRLILCSVCMISGTDIYAQKISESFELRYFTKDSKANGETDFHGETEVFNTDQRIVFLHQYGNYARKFFQDAGLNTRIVTDQEAENFLNGLKPAPKPSARKRIIPGTWKWIGFNPDKRTEEIAELEKWNNIKGVEVNDQSLVFRTPNSAFKREIQEQAWRFKFQFDIKIMSAENRFSMSMLSGGKSVAGVGVNTSNRFFYTSGFNVIQLGKCSIDHWHTFEMEVDLVENRYNLYIDKILQADFVLMGTDPVKRITAFAAEANEDVRMDNLYGVSYIPTKIDLIPYTVHTFIDEDFIVRPQLTGWSTFEYDDSNWEETTLPKVHGGDRYAGEDLYLRRYVRIGNFERAELNFETLDPGGEIWVNGQITAVITNRYPVKIDVSEYLKPNEDNLIAVCVKSSVVDFPLEHSGGGDPNIGWFAGRMYLDLTKKNYIDEVLVNAVEVKDPADMRNRIRVINESNKNFEGKINVKYYKWFPEESSFIAAEDEFPVQINGTSRVEIDRILPVKNPVLWTFNQPSLYKVQVLLKDTSGNIIDDYLLTNGIRTISQDGGIFRINGKPEMLNGAQIFGCRMPPDRIAMWNRCAPASELAKEMLMIKKMNGNMVRIHVHTEQYKTDGINDPRIAEMCDQLGLMIIWQTPAWIRNGSFWNVDFEGYPKYIRQVYNHPSIVMWEVTNHPWPWSRPYTIEETNRIFTKVHQTIYPLDPSRLISPASHNKVFSVGNDAGTIDNNGKSCETVDAYRAPMITRGNQDSFTGYGRKWSDLRKLPDKYVSDFLNSPDRAYFNFEHEESIGQPNWTLAKGKPWYKLQSYEWNYDTGSIGRKLTADEWPESQAWQAFSAWESMKKQRILGYDGFSWCNLHGGPNMGTYKKPLVDELGHAKLSYYANKMIFQRTVAGSDNVDVVYGPEDSIHPVIMNLGDAGSVDLTVTIKSVDGKVIDVKEYKETKLSGGRTVTRLDTFKPKIKSQGTYAIEYRISNVK